MMAVMNLRVCISLLVLALGAGRLASAEPVVIYSNFGSPPGYLSEGWRSSEENGYYMGFQLTDPAALTSITVPVSWGGNRPFEFGAGVYASSDGNRGELIEQIVIPFPADVPAGTVTMLTFPSSLQPMLSASTLYFLGVNAWSVSGEFGFGFVTLWPWNNAGIEGIVVSSNPVGNFPIQGTLSAFQLQGELNPVPEPTSMLLVATGAGLVVQRVRRRRRAA